MTILATSAIGDALKQYYLEGLRYQINYKADPLWAELEKNSEDVRGLEAVASLRYGRSGGVGARADDGDLPTANARKSKKVTFDLKNLYARMQITSKVIEISKTDRAAFVSQLEQVMDDLMVDAKDYVQRQVYGDGTGKLATVSAVNGNTLTLDKIMGFAEGQLVDIMTSANAVRLAGVEITSVDFDNKTITVSNATGVVGTDYIVTQGSYNLEMTGMDKIFTPNTTLYGLDRSTYKFLNPTILAVNGEINEVKIQEGLDTAEMLTGVEHDFLIGSHGVRRAWQNLLSAQRQLVNTVELKGGWKVPAYENNGRILPFIAAKYAPSGKLRAISRKNFKVAWMGDWDWMAKDGAILSRVANKPAYEATLEMYAELFCDLPRGQVQWSGIQEH